MKKTKVYDVAYTKKNSLFGSKKVLTTKKEREQLAKQIKRRDRHAVIVESAKPAKHRSSDRVDEMIMFDLLFNDD